MDLGLNGKKAIVTGGSRGIGLATVKTLAAEGADVSFCARTQESIESAVHACADLDGEVIGSICDITDLGAQQEWINASAERMGGIDLSVANVSGMSTVGDDPWQQCINADLLGTVTTCETSLQHMVQSKGGAIVVVSSISGLEVSGAPPAYGTIKSGLISYAAQMAINAAPHGIRINSVSPGPIHVEDGFWGRLKQGDPAQYQAVEQAHGAGRLGTTEEVANAIAFLLSPAASWVTGTNVKIDGGFTKGIQF